MTSFAVPRGSPRRPAEASLATGAAGLAWAWAWAWGGAERGARGRAERSEAPGLGFSYDFQRFLCFSYDFSRISLRISLGSL